MKDIPGFGFSKNCVFIEENEFFKYRVLEAVSAGMNDGGVVLYFGIKENENGYEVEGLKNPDALLASLHALLSQDPRLSFHRVSSRDFLSLEEGGKKALCLFVQEAEGKDKPVSFAGLCYLFENGKIVPMPEKARQSLADIARPMEADSRPVPSTSFSDFDEASFRLFRKEFEARHNQFRFATPSEFAKRLSLLFADGSCTEAGLLFLGKEEAIRRGFPSFELRLIVNEKGKQEIVSSSMGDCPGNLFSFQRLALDCVKKTSGERASIEVGELLLNAIQNADYRQENPLVIEVSSEEILARNAGICLDSGRLGLPSCRHPLLQRWFLSIGIGVLRGMRDVLSSPFPAYSIQSDFEANATLSSLRFVKPKAPAPSPRESKKKEKDAFYESLLPLFKEEIAGKIREFKKKSGDEVFGRGDLMDATGVSPATATQMIKKLQKAKKIRPVKGQGKGKFRFR